MDFLIHQPVLGSSWVGATTTMGDPPNPLTAVLGTSTGETTSVFIMGDLAEAAVVLGSIFVGVIPAEAAVVLYGVFVGVKPAAGEPLIKDLCSANVLGDVLGISW